MPDATSASPLEALSASLADHVARTALSLVAVHSYRARSSGFAWRPGLIVTADEALAEEGEIRVVLPSGEAVTATIAGRDPTTDVALLRVEGTDVAAAAWAEGSPSAGALALAVGQGDGSATAALGVVSVSGGPWRSMRGGEIDARLELDLRLRGSAEGGLALDAAGRAFGMVVSGPRRRTLVIPASTIGRVAARLESHGRVARGYLGIGLQSVRLAGGEGSGLMAMSVDAGGPAAEAGVRQGDVIAGWNGLPVPGLRALLRGLGAESVGTTVALALLRGGEPVALDLTIGERPD